MKQANVWVKDKRYLWVKSHEDTRTNRSENRTEKRFPPPSDVSKETALFIAEEIMDRLNIAQLYTISVTGRTYLSCPNTGCSSASKDGEVRRTRVHWSLKSCPVCGTYVPSDKQFHSSVSWEDGMWKIVLARDVTQAKSPIDQVANVVPPYGMVKDGKGELWPLFINIVWLITPIIYANTKQIKPWQFAPAQWREYAEKTHIKWARVVAKSASAILMPIVAIKHK